MFRIFVTDYVPSLNKGEATILEGMLESFKVLGEIEVATLSHHPEIDAPRYTPKIRIVDATKCLPISSRSRDYSKVFKMFLSADFMLRHIIFSILHKVFGSKVLSFMRAEIWKEYIEADVIIEGHNGAFGIGAVGIGIPVYLYPLYLPLFAKAIGKPVVLYGGSIGRPGRLRWFASKAFKFALDRMDLITLRERISSQNLKTIGFQGKCVFVTADPAFLLQPASPERVREIMKQESIEKDSNLLIGMTVTRKRASMAFPEFSSRWSSYHKHIETLAEVIDHLTGKHNATVIFIPHCIGFAKELDDRIVAKDIFQKCQNKEKVKVITNEYSAAELKGLIGQFNLFIGERLHSVINAMSMGVPSIVISNSADQRLDIIRMLGQDDAICFVENLDSEAVLAKINDIWSKRDRIKEELKSQVEIMRERARLNGRLLNELLDSRKLRD